MWKFFAAMMASFLAISIILCAITSVKQGAGFFTVAKKNLQTFIISLTTASSAAAFGSNIDAAKKRYGVADEMAGFSVPLGMIMHNPVAACYNILLVIYFAASYGVSCSFGWLIIAVIVSTTVAISTPPIPGGASVGYALLISQLGVPDEALAVILVLDVITDFIVTASNAMFCRSLLPIFPASWGI